MYVIFLYFCFSKDSDQTSEATSFEINGYKLPTSRLGVGQEPFLKSERLQ